MGIKVSKKEFAIIREKLRSEGKKIAHCHGVFDLVHPGHMEHFKEAAKMGDILVVSVTSDKYVRKGPGRPFFSNEIRINFLCAIEYIDYVILSEGYTADDVIEVVRPNYWVKGEEYRNPANDTTHAQASEVALVRKYGGDIRFTSGFRSSSSFLLNKSLASFSDELMEYLIKLKERYSLVNVEKACDMFSKLSVLVIGDVIIDQYIYCAPPRGMTKDTGHSTRILSRESSLGGSIAVARHIAAFCDKVDLISIIGSEKDVLEKIKDELSHKVGNRLISAKDYYTIIKTKYIVRNEKRQELNKLFSVNNIQIPAHIPVEARKQFTEFIENNVSSYDLVVVCDYGHGLIEEETINLVENKSKLLSVNCQTNATNYGLNLITKYKRADFFSLDQNELKLAMHNDSIDEAENLRRLKKKIGAKAGWLTRGSQGAFGISDKVIDCPAVSTIVKDTIGAGDAFFSLASLAASVGSDIEFSTFMGNVGGALGANIIGNTRSLEKNDVLKFSATLFNI